MTFVDFRDIYCYRAACFACSFLTRAVRVLHSCTHFALYLNYMSPQSTLASPSLSRKSPSQSLPRSSPELLSDSELNDGEEQQARELAAHAKLQKAKHQREYYQRYIVSVSLKF